MLSCFKLLLLSFLLVFSAIQVQSLVEDKYNAAAKECYKIENVNTEDLNKEQTQLDLESNPKYKAFTLCKFRKLGYINENGDVLTHVIKSDILECTGDEQKTTKIMESLKSCMQKKATPEETAVTLHGCISVK